jgi:hypothetical protein
MRLMPTTFGLLLLPLLAAGCGGKAEEGATAGECIDEIDNDDDGGVDCDDAGCAVWDFCAEGGDDSGDGTGDDGTGDDGTGDDGTGDDGTGDDGTGDDGTGDDTDSGGGGDDTDTGGGGPSAFAGLCINEFMASNSSTITDEKGAYPDWIELHNPTGAAMDLSGVTVTDDLADETKHELQNLVLDAGGFLVLFADDDEEEGDNHVGFSLSAEGEEIGIYDPDGVRLDALEYAKQVTDVSAYRTTDCGEVWDYTTEPTPGESNE